MDLARSAELPRASNVDYSNHPQWRAAMPVLMWIAFWSCMMGAATCWQEAGTARVRESNHRDHPAV